jgi:hypothetical protein
VIDSEHAKAKALDRKKQRAAEASSKGLSPDEYRKVIVRAYRKD